MNNPSPPPDDPYHPPAPRPEWNPPTVPGAGDGQPAAHAAADQPPAGSDPWSQGGHAAPAGYAAQGAPADPAGGYAPPAAGGYAPPAGGGYAAPVEAPTSGGYAAQPGGYAAQPGGGYAAQSGGYGAASYPTAAGGYPSAPGYPTAQMSGPPMSRPPMSGPPVPARGRGRGLITLGVVAALLFVASGLLGGLLFASNGDLTRTEKLLAAEERRSTAAEDKVKTLEAQLRASNDRAGDLQETLQGAEGDRDEQERQKQVIATCLDRFTEALGATSQSEFEKLIKKAEKPCEEAEDYM